MKRIFVFLCLSILFCAFPLAPQSMATPKEKKPPVVLMPLYGGPGVASEHLGAYESAVKKALSEKYTVYSGDRVMEKLKKIFQIRSAGEKGSLECDETKCYQDVAIAFQSELIAAARITKSESGYLLSINIVNVGEDAVVFTNSTTCRGCDELEVVESLYLLAGGRKAVKENAKYADWGDGTVTAKNTGLMWQKQDDGKERDWDDAIAYCKGLGLAGYSDWRLPSKEELKSLIEGRSWGFDWEGERKAGYSKEEVEEHWKKKLDIEKAQFIKEGRTSPVIDTEYFSDTQQAMYWSSTTTASNTTYAWSVHFNFGVVASGHKTLIHYYVRCVRLGQ